MPEQTGEDVAPGREDRLVRPELFPVTSDLHIRCLGVEPERPFTNDVTS